MIDKLKIKKFKINARFSIKWILIFVLFILFLALIAYILNLLSIIKNKDKLASFWNEIVANKIDKKGKDIIKFIPYTSAWFSNNKYIRDFHSMITVNHRSVYKEIFDAMATSKFVLPNVDSNIDSFIVSNEVYNRKYNRKNYSLSTLIKIASDNKYIEQVYITILASSHITKSRVYNNKGLERYIYVLKNNNNNASYVSENGNQIDLFGIKILGNLMPITEGIGYVYDDTLSNHWWNFSNNTIVLIEARISRDLGFIYNYMHSFVLWYD